MTFLSYPKKYETMNNYQGTINKTTIYKYNIYNICPLFMHKIGIFHDNSASRKMTKQVGKKIFILSNLHDCNLNSNII